MLYQEVTNALVDRVSTFQAERKQVSHLANGIEEISRQRKRLWKKIARQGRETMKHLPL